MSQQDEGDDLLWDPIDDAVEYDRGNFVELIKHFLWRENAPSTKMNVLNDTAAKTNGSITLYGTAAIVEGPGLVTARKDLKSSKKKSKIKSTTSKADDVPTDISESKSDMRRRLKEGSEYQQQDEPGLWLVRGAIDNPFGLTRTLPLPDAEIDKLFEEISEIKHLLFCRMLLSMLHCF